MFESNSNNEGGIFLTISFMMLVGACVQYISLKESSKSNENQRSYRGKGLATQKTRNRVSQFFNGFVRISHVSMTFPHMSRSPMINTTGIQLQCKYEGPSSSRSGDRDDRVSFSSKHSLVRVHSLLPLDRKPLHR